jgi:predicted nuclease of predicted toxin-antitoxin system
VKLLLDENLSRQLVSRIEDLFPGSRHIASEGLVQASHAEIWNYARANGFAIVSADADFYELAISLGTASKGRLVERL